MRIGRQVTKTVTNTEEDTYTCDLCNSAIPKGDTFEANKTQLHYAVGEVYPEGDLRTHYKIDVCHTCFDDKLQPLLLKTFGVQFRESDEYFDKVLPEVKDASEEPNVRVAKTVAF